MHVYFFSGFFFKNKGQNYYKNLEFSLHKKSNCQKNCRKCCLIFIKKKTIVTLKFSHELDSNDWQCIMYIWVMSSNYFTDTCYLRNADLYHNNYLEVKDSVKTLENCQAKCIDNKNCRVFTFKPSAKKCWLISSWASSKVEYENNGYISGWQGCKFLWDFCAFKG